MHEGDDELIESITPDVLRVLENDGFFRRLDDLLCPEITPESAEKCTGKYEISESLLVASGFDEVERGDIFQVLLSLGGCCDCEILYNVLETSRLKAKYWKAEYRKRQAEHSDE